MASFSPAEDAADKPIYFVGVQWESKEDFSRRFFGEISFYLYGQPSARDWRAVAIFAAKTPEGEG
ncbi:MAG: Rpn family recombination-promoting nuclease/putative transposase [Oscillatoria princeps RMCB-10]|jgi:predicted transposase YdaD|nr:Rpn family recombination-promoting nuclease/putative transposase [Oscillatoria princeps RMCB-10]